LATLNHILAGMITAERAIWVMIVAEATTRVTIAGGR
jgi:hypothetical protein